MTPASSAEPQQRGAGVARGGVLDGVRGQSRRQPPQPPVDAREGMRGDLALRRQPGHGLDEQLVQREEGHDRKAAKSLPRRDRSTPARLVVNEPGQRDAEQHLEHDRDQTATMHARPPRARPTVTPSSPITLASGHAPAAEAASSPTASERVRSGYSASVAGSSVPSRPKDMIGRISQPKANR